MIKRSWCGLTVFMVLSGMAAGAASAQTDMGRFPLTKAIPADAFIAVAARENPERKFLEDYWAVVGKEFLDSGILEGVWDMVTESVPDEKVDELEEAKDRLLELVKQVQWGDLFRKEMVYAGRFHPPTPGTGSIYEGVLIGRMDKKSAAANYEALKAILAEAEKMISAHAGEGTIVLKESKEGEMPIASLVVVEEQMPIVSLAQRDDLVFISIMGEGILRDALALLKGEAKKPGLAESARFKSAFAALPPAEDSLVFWDIDGTISPIRGMFTALAKNKPAADKPAGGADEADEAEPWLKLVGSVLDDISLGDYMASVEWTDGYRVFSESVTTTRSDAKGKPLYEIIAGNKPIDNWEKYVPKEAVTFDCTSGVNWSKLYRYIINFVKTRVPEGDKAIANFEALQKEWELDLEKDIFSLLQGEMISAKVGEQHFIMCKLTDEKRANAQLKRLVDKIKKPHESEGQQEMDPFGLMVNEITIAGEKGFTQITNPMMAIVPGLAPVIGCADGYLIVGTSPEAVAACLETGHGKRENVTKNERWQKEALPTKNEAIVSITFADETKKGEELQQAFASISVAMALMPRGQGLPPEVSKMVSAISPLLTKLARVVGKLDFYQSSSEVSSFDGKMWRCREVQNYKTPQPKSPGEEKERNGDTAKKAEEKKEPKAEKKRDTAGNKKLEKGDKKADNESKGGQKDKEKSKPRKD